jgi:HSP90 family molecular chaperone
MTKKLTKKEMFAMVIEVVNGVEVENREEMLNFLNHEVELLNKKSSKSGETKTQKENKVLMEQLKEALAEMTSPVTISEFQEKSTHEIATLSNQKLSALLKKLVESEEVVKTSEKKKSYFALVRK